MKTVDNTKKIVALHELLNRMIVPINDLEFNTRQPRIAAIRQEIAELQAAQSKAEPYEPVNYADVITMSVVGRLRIAVYPYPKNKYNNIERHNKVVRFAKFNKALKILKYRIAQMSMS